MKLFTGNTCYQLRACKHLKNCVCFSCEILWLHPRTPHIFHACFVIFFDRKRCLFHVVHVFGFATCKIKSYAPLNLVFVAAVVFCLGRVAYCPICPTSLNTFIGNMFKKSAACYSGPVVQFILLSRLIAA